MNASDIMTTPVITVNPGTPLHDVVDLLLAHRISGVLVMEDDKVVGVIGDGDLLHRHEIGTDRWAEYRTWWQRLTRLDPGPVAYVKANGGHAGDVMSTDVVSVDFDTPIGQIAVIFEARHIRRIPVLKDGQLQGLVTRAGLMRALAASDTYSTRSAETDVDDEAILKRLMSELNSHSWWSSSWSSVFVNKGIVSYVGVVQRVADKDAARIAAENIPGVCAVEDRRTLYGEGQAMF
jgi:CBS domain-containing protein